MTRSARFGAEALGVVGGWALAPFTGTLSRVRRARMFHPDGVVLRATIAPDARDARSAELASRLAGPALVRLSAALWRGGREWPDVLGIALRARGDDAATAVPAPGDQDLLFATIRHPWTMPFAPLSTDAHDFLANDYFAVSPFDAPPLGRVVLRLRRPDARAPGANRLARLLATVARGDAVFALESAPVGSARYAPLARVHLGERVDVDERALRFDPFRAGRGVVPRGFVHALRVGAYAASRWGRAAAGA